ncbi:MAG: sulfotransferase domain-containing protein [Microcoleaceae cyanobacterium]
MIKAEKKLEILLKNGKSIQLELPLPADIPSFFVFGMHKSGSVMLMSIIREICSHVNIPVIEFENFLSRQGIESSLVPDNTLNIFVQEGYGFAGFRMFPDYLQLVNTTGLKKILLIRDPRDILVSWYFSLKKSHTIPPGKRGEKILIKRKELLETPIDQFALGQAKVILSRMNVFKDKMSEDPEWKLFRYEDIIFDKYQWVKDILAFLEFELEEDVIREIAEKHDIVPNKENESVHIRQVIPGDHKRKLQQSTIEKLDREFYLILRDYGYV